MYQLQWAEALTSKSQYMLNQTLSKPEVASSTHQS